MPDANEQRLTIPQEFEEKVKKLTARKVNEVTKECNKRIFFELMAKYKWHLRQSVVTVVKPVDPGRKHFRVMYYIGNMFGREIYCFDSNKSLYYASGPNWVPPLVVKIDPDEAGFQGMIWLATYRLEEAVAKNNRRGMTIPPRFFVFQYITQTRYDEGGTELNKTARTEVIKAESFEKALARLKDRIASNNTGIYESCYSFRVGTHEGWRDLMTRPVFFYGRNVFRTEFFLVPTA